MTSPIERALAAREPAAVSVSSLTRRIKAVLEEDIGRVRVEGEISNLFRSSAGHWYFTLKDASARISAVLFASAARALHGSGERLEDGLLVRVEADVSVYEKRGQYQLIVRRVLPAGQGLLLARFEALKRRLQAEGLCDASRKKPLPRLPRRIGLVTSRQGAAIRDILNVLTRRFPNLHIVLAPVRVQGEGAAEEIAAGIDLLNERGGLDVLIVGRGGGSLEDLWAFNEEPVARAIARSALPVISAVGHEVDVTLSDLVADLRAPTPSAAAELVVGCKEAFLQQLEAAEKTMRSRLDARRRELEGRLRTARASHVFREPRHALETHTQHLDFLSLRLSRAVRGRVEEARHRLDNASAGLRLRSRGRFETPRVEIGMLARRLRRALGTEAARRRETVGHLARRLESLNPLDVLRRGYSLTTATDGRLLRAIGAAAPGEEIVTRLSDGSLTSKVLSARPESGAAPEPVDESGNVGQTLEPNTK